MVRRCACGWSVLTQLLFESPLTCALFQPPFVQGFLSNGEQPSPFIAACLCHSMDTGAGELNRPLDCYVGFSELPVLRLTSHMHSGAPMAVSPSCGILFMPLLASDSNPSNSRTTIQDINDEKASTTLGFLSNGEEPSAVFAACLCPCTLALSPACLPLPKLAMQVMHTSSCLPPHACVDLFREIA